MGATVSPSSARRHRLLPDVADRMARADVRKAENSDWKAEIGRVVERVKNMSGLSLKEFADAIRRDERQVARWIAGVERPQFDAVFAVDTLRQPLIVALAELAGQGVEIETTVRIRRTA